MPHDTDLVRLAVIGAVLLTLGASVLTGTAAAQTESDDPTIRVSSATVQPDETATVDVVLTSAPDGLAGYAVDLSVEGEGAAITGASYPDTFGLTSEPTVVDDGTSVTLEAADLGENVQPGASDVVLATVELGGESGGETTLAVEPLQFDTDGGGSMTPTSESGTVTVSADGDVDAAAAATDSQAASDVSAESTASTGDAETTSTAFALPAGGIALTALALTLVVGFGLRRRQ
jgi:hypothetical protein